MWVQTEATETIGTLHIFDTWYYKYIYVDTYYKLNHSKRTFIRMLQSIKVLEFMLLSQQLHYKQPFIQ